MESMGGVNWDMIKAITGIMSFVMAIIGAGIVLLTRWIFITKKEFQIFCEKNGKEINNKLYDKKGTTIFLPRQEYDKDVANRTMGCNIEHTKLQIELEKIKVELEKIKAVLVPRPEWVDSKTGRERRTGENLKTICGKIQDVSNAINDMRKESSTRNEALNKLTGSFETYLELEKQKTT
ncbi:MAG: hypothetical protein KAS66_09445 [Candidatus Omnitrophica bacterium]|nr:hypothetical protein [Candidatus Omnitrophota bacterium]